MEHDPVKQRLSRVRLSTPRVTLGDVERRLAAEAARRPAGFGGLVLAAVLVWALAWAAQTRVEQSLEASVRPPGAPTAAATALPFESARPWAEHAREPDLREAWEATGRPHRWDPADTDPERGRGDRAEAARHV